MANVIYDGYDGVDVVKQTNSYDYDEIYTYAGNDRISLTLTYTYVEAGNGNDVVTSSVEGYNEIWLGAGNDIYNGNGFSTVGARYDLVYGGDGNDTFNIQTSHSEYYGGNGSDRFNSIGLNNLFDGGAGIDTISYKFQDQDPDLSGNGVYLDLGAQYADTGAARREDVLNIENAEGTSYGDTLIGGSGNSKLWGINGNDIVKGMAGNDDLYGGNGNDDLYGGTGNDWLIGGAGNDLLVGNSGADTFYFLAKGDSVKGSNRDVISDFSHSADDQVDLSYIDAISGSGNDEFDYIGSAAFSGTAGELHFRGGILSGDINGDGVADFEIKLNGVTKLYDSDLVL